MVDTGAYQIINVKGGTALDASGTDEGAIIGWENHQGANQKWYIEKRNNERYRIGNLGSGKYLGLASNDFRNDLRARSVDDGNFEWQIRKDDQDQNAYRFFVPDTQFNLDLTDFGNSTNGTPVAIWDKWQAMNQCWYLIPLSEAASK